MGIEDIGIQISCKSNGDANGLTISDFRYKTDIVTYTWICCCPPSNNVTQRKLLPSHFESTELSRHQKIKDLSASVLREAEANLAQLGQLERQLRMTEGNKGKACWGIL